jgi:hypothetical protein
MIITMTTSIYGPQGMEYLSRSLAYHDSDSESESEDFSSRDEYGGNDTMHTCSACRFAICCKTDEICAGCKDWKCYCFSFVDFMTKDNIRCEYDLGHKKINPSIVYSCNKCITFLSVFKLNIPIIPGEPAVFRLHYSDEVYKKAALEYPQKWNVYLCSPDEFYLNRLKPIFSYLKNHLKNIFQTEKHDYSFLIPIIINYLRDPVAIFEYQELQTNGVTNIPKVLYGE